MTCGDHALKQSTRRRESEKRIKGEANHAAAMDRRLVRCASNRAFADAMRFGGGCEALECSRIIYAWKSTWGLDADRRGKFLRMFGTEGSTAEAD